MTQKLERILRQVQKPARYVGGEYGQIIKNKDEVDVRVAFCFPDTYEIGMSNVGMRILYGVMNRMDGVWCERVFAPWGDMEEQMRSHGIPLYALESKDPVKDFDLIAFSVGYEMSYTNLLNMLDLAGIPLRAKDRKGLKNMVYAGGACMYNPEPLADFLDFVCLGEGEEVTPEILELYRKAKKEQWDKEAFLEAAAKIPGIYVPSFYEHRYGPDGTLEAIVPRPGVPETVQKRIVKDLDKAYYPVDTLVPSTEIVHDRTNVEVFRGCIRGCRFCQAGFCYRPVRSKSPEVLYRQAAESLAYSGNDEITLSSLSTSDYRHLETFADRMLEYCVPRKIKISLPSLRADNFSRELMLKLRRGGGSSLTFAPEAGTQRLRDAINKNLTEEEILTTCQIAFSGGWNSVKLYFMLGLPTETDEDVLGIAELVWKVIKTWKAYASNKKRGLSINLATAFFIPKPFTPFQWEAQISSQEYARRVRLLQDAIKTKMVDYRYHGPELSRLEAVLARGDRRLGAVLEEAVKRGAKLDSWEEYFRLDAWEAAFQACGIDPDVYSRRQFEKEDVLPWQTISVGVSRDFFWREKEQAFASRVTPDCRSRCSGCGADRLIPEGKCDA